MVKKVIGNGVGGFGCDVGRAWGLLGFWGEGESESPELFMTDF